jgi:hypothetical protein
MSTLRSKTSPLAICEYWRQHQSLTQSESSDVTEQADRITIVRTLTAAEQVRYRHQYREGDQVALWFGGFGANNQLIVVCDDAEGLIAALEQQGYRCHSTRH